MYVNTKCGKFNETLINDTLDLDNRSILKILKCLNGHVKIKSLLCCSQDKSCII